MRFADLYALPHERFRSLIAPAVRLGIRRGDFNDYAAFTPPEEDNDNPKDNNSQWQRDTLAEATAVELIL